MTRSMDREEGVKRMEDMCQLTERRTERKYFGSYGQIAKCIGKLVAAHLKVRENP